ncbi:MAG TPA: FHA domain-containing protein [Rugosimonospora sp.]
MLTDLVPAWPSGSRPGRMNAIDRQGGYWSPLLDGVVVPCPVCAGPCSARWCPGCGHDLLSRDRLALPHNGANDHGGANDHSRGANHGGANDHGGGNDRRDGDGPRGGLVRAGWVAVAQADPDYYETANATGDLEAPRVPFPRAWPARYFALDGERAWIGRRGRGRSHRPEIDLGGWPADPGVSRLHALLLAVAGGAQPEPGGGGGGHAPRFSGGGWALMDPGSAAGTTVNDDPIPIPVDALVPVGAGDRIHLGAWTTIVLQRSGAPW